MQPEGRPVAGGDIFHISSMYFASASGLTSKMFLPAALTPEIMCAKWRETSSSCCTKLILSNDPAHARREKTAVEARECGDEPSLGEPHRGTGYE